MYCLGMCIPTDDLERVKQLISLWSFYMNYQNILEDLDLELTQIDVFSDELCYKLENYKSKLLYKQMWSTCEKLKGLEKRQEKVSNLYNKIIDKVGE